MAVFWLLLAGLNLVLAVDNPAYFMEGGKLTLDLRPPSSQAITNILWKFQGNLLAEWVKGVVELTYYSTFKGRTTLDTQTGRLEISSMTKADIGLYSVEINNNVQTDRYRAVLIKEVPQPEVWITPLVCGPTSESCDATCEGNTTECGPVTYSWKMGDGDWKVLKKTVPITKADTSGVKTLACRVENPLTEKESEPYNNPLFQEDVPAGSGAGAIAGGIIFALIILIVAVGAGVAWYLKIGPFKNRGSDSSGTQGGNGLAKDPPADSPSDKSNNSPAPENVPLTAPSNPGQ